MAILYSAKASGFAKASNSLLDRKFDDFATFSSWHLLHLQDFGGNVSRRGVLFNL